MLKKFAHHFARLARQDQRLMLLTGDVGLKVFEEISRTIGQRFLNMGVAEQNMISVAAGLAYQGMIPFCYSIAPFVTLRPAEQIKIDVALHRMNVKIVGNGGGYGYGVQGATHHALEDLALMSSFPNMKCCIPFCEEDVEGILGAMLDETGPAYLRLGLGVLPSEISLSSIVYGPIRQVMWGDSVTIVAMGAVALEAMAAVKKNGSGQMADVFIVSELPLIELSSTFLQSVAKTGKLIVIEEHVKRGGLGEHLAWHLMHSNWRPPGKFSFHHRYALGHPDDLCGSQKFHQKKCGLDCDSIAKLIEGGCNPT